MYINSQSFRVNQGQPQYYRFGTYGDRLWDDKGWLDVTGEKVVTSENKHYPVNLDVKENDLPTGFTNLNKSVVKTDEETSVETQNKKVSDDNFMFGMTKEQLLIGVGLGIVAGFIIYHGYKSYIQNKSSINNLGNI
jgi:hypothetical protein